jgi:predicted TIM-barrel fold metal-dependent hydrolase
MIIDVWGQVLTPRMAQAPWLAPLLRWTGQDPSEVRVTPDLALHAMDAAGVDMMILSAWSAPDGWLISNDELDAQIDAAPDRFKGMLSVDISKPADAARAIRERFDGERYVAVRVLPWVWDLPPNHAWYYPVYAACVEVGAPFCTQIGHTGPLRRSEVGRLIPYLEDVLLDFPELVVVGGHVGFPWINELTSLTVKFPNLYVDTSAYALHRLPPDFVSYMKTVGKDRVMFGTNWPMLDPARCLKGLDGLGLDDAHKARFLSGLAKDVFKIGG